MPPPIHEIITGNIRAIEQLCRQHSVRELCAFGSVITDHFDPQHSDVDIMADFYSPEAPGIADRFMALAIGLETIFQRPVDLVTKSAIKNPVFRRIVEQNSQPIYAG